MNSPQSADFKKVQHVKIGPKLTKLQVFKNDGHKNKGREHKYTKTQINRKKHFFMKQIKLEKKL